MRKVYIQRHRPMYLAWWKRSWSWWYVAYGEHQPFARFGHGGWICLNFKWLRRFWKGCSPRPECAGAILLALLLLPALAHSQAVAISNGSTTAQSPSTPVSFTSAGGPLAVEYNGQWSAASVERETLDIADFGATKANHVLVNGIQLEMPGSGVNLYMGGVALEPDLTALFKRTNLPAGSLGAFVDGNVGVGTPAIGASEISWMAGAGVTYRLASALTWQPLTVQYGRFGSQGFVAMSTQLEFAFKR